MKKYAFLSLIMVLSVTALVAQNRETRKVDTFTRISLRVPATVYVKQGNPQSLEIEASKDDLKELETTVEGSKLVIERPGKWINRDSDEKITIYITVANLEAVGVSGSGSIIGKSKFVTQDLDLNVSGSGSLTLDIDADGDVNADVSGSGDIALNGKCKTFDSDISGSGKVKLGVTVTQQADFNVSGSGRIEAGGAADFVKASISGSGKVLAADMQANRCEVRISGSGTVEVNVKNELDANISGSGSVSYKGEPAKVNSNSSGSGRVSKM